MDSVTRDGGFFTVSHMDSPGAMITVEPRKLQPGTSNIISLKFEEVWEFEFKRGIQNVHNYPLIKFSHLTLSECSNQFKYILVLVLHFSRIQYQRIYFHIDTELMNPVSIGTCFLAITVPIVITFHSRLTEVVSGRMAKDVWSEMKPSGKFMELIWQSWTAIPCSCIAYSLDVQLHLIMASKNVNT